MADKNSNILKQLQDHELTPPAGAFDKAWNSILLQDEGTGNSEQAGKNAFEKLQEYSMKPPELDFKAVLAGEKKKATKKTVTVISKNVMRVAAFLAIAVTGVVIYWAMPKKNNDRQLVTGTGQYVKESFSTGQDKQEATVNKKPAEEPVASAGEKQPGGSDKNAVALRGRLSKTIKGRGLNYGGAGGFYNNDIFFTLVNYKEYGKERLFSKTIRDKRITLNQYSYVNLSDKMVAMLQDVYLTKRNGKPSRKAKKAKRKFEKWRKKDEKYFDKNLDKNPADIIDLSEFLMKN